MIAFFFLGLLVFLLLNIPVAFALILVCLIYLLSVGQVPLQMIPQRILGATDSFLLLAIPYFLLAGALMNTGGITTRLVRLSRVLVGHITGGLAHVVIVTNMIMAGFSGSAIADGTATGSVLIPAMVRERYDRGFSAAVTAAAATIGPIIPPSVAMIIYASIINASVARMFLGGIIPGILMGIYLMIVAYWRARKRGYPRERRSSWGELFSAVKEASLALLMPLIIIGGIFSGVFTPTEAAVIAAAYALVVGMFVYKEIRWSDLPRIARDVTVGSAVIMLIIAAASPFGWLLAFGQVPQQIVRLFSGIEQLWIILLVINVFLLLLGCFMEGTAILVILTPVLTPLIVSRGVDPVHFGVVMVLNIMIGMLTPPFGMLMFITSDIAQVSIETFTREALIFILALIAVLMLITYVPSSVLYVPNLLLGRG